MEVGGGQEFLGAFEEPADLLKILTLRAVTIATGVEGQTLVTATVAACLQMAPEGWGAAAGDVPDDLALFGARGTGLEIVFPVAA
jgi:hypothetical protein